MRRLAALLSALALLMLAGCAPAGVRDLEGDFAAHDPALVAGDDGEPWFVYSTGDALVDRGALQIRRSDDGGATWRYAGSVWKDRPAWIADAVPNVPNLWAPDLVEHDGSWYLYYAASTFGSNRSVIGLATNTTLDPSAPEYAWVDRGVVIASVATDDFNAIDPGFVEDADGDPWLAFGSFWSGIRMVPLAWPDGLRADADADADAEPIRVAGGREGPNAIEAPTIVRHGDSYVLFVSIGACCQGVDSTYEIAVGRADEVTGPYVDRAGIPLLNGGGTVLLSSDGSRIGPGGESVSGEWLGFHYYDAELDGDFRLAIVQVGWDGEGWPELSW